jgi:hypothetical protein
MTAVEVEDVCVWRRHDRRRLRAAAAVSSVSVWRWRMPACGNGGDGGLLRRQRRLGWRTPAAAELAAVRDVIPQSWAQFEGYEYTMDVTPQFLGRIGSWH